MKTLIIDNYDSFTFNLYQLVAEISGSEPMVIFNDTHTYEEILQLPIDNIIISPGPGHPERWKDFGICKRVIQESQLPVLGICLGHQGLCTAFGGKVILAPEPMHGRISHIHHSNDPLFEGIPPVFTAVRYHSLMVDSDLPACLQTIAVSEDGVIMGLRHQTRPLWGIQYHPESICTEHGKQLLKNFLSQSSKACDVPFNAKIPLDFFSNATAGAIYFTDPKKNDQEVHRYTLSVTVCDEFPDSANFFQRVFEKNIPVVWLDSSRMMPEISRFSIMGCLNGPLSYALRYDVSTSTITHLQGKHQRQFKMSLFDFLKAELEHYAVAAHDYPFQFFCGFVGYLGYELFQETLPLKAHHLSPYPDAQFLFLDRAVVFDHQEKKCYLLALHETGKPSGADDWFGEMKCHLHDMPKFELEAHHESFSSDMSEIKISQSGAVNQTKTAYLEHIQACLKAIYAGESYEICLTNQLKSEVDIDPLVYYMHLRRINPAPYAAFMRFDTLAIASSSIERFLQIDATGQVETKPIKGTLPRGKTPEEDERFKHQLQHDTQFKSENLMIVDLLRNDLGRVCEIGSVHVPKLMQVESYPTLHQLVSTIRGKLRRDLSSIDCIRAAFPGGSMTGAPKIRTVDIIQQLETEARGIYSGSMGYLSLNGSVDLNIVIRTAVLSEKKLSIGVGGAVIALSDPEQEYEEMLLKARSLWRALQVVIKAKFVRVNPQSVCRSEN